MDIVKDKEYLKKKCDKVELQQGIKTGKILLGVLQKHKSGIGLAANQVGINESVCVVNVTSPLILVNPGITGEFGSIVTAERCLSFPGEFVITKRPMSIVVECDYNGTKRFDSREDLLELVCVCHEIDHLNGITMHERKK